MWNLFDVSRQLLTGSLSGTMMTRLRDVEGRLMGRIILDEHSPRPARFFWLGVTQLGGSLATVTAAALPLLFGLPIDREAGTTIMSALALSHLVVQVMKRVFRRDRPTYRALIAHPDRFSFPSGHSTAALAIALGYSIAVPAIAVPLIALGIVIGWSRVVLGVHYPGDVIAGQLIAAATVALLR